MAQETQRRIRVGIDTGGTFTDVVAFDEDTGELVTTKTPSTPANPADGFIAGIEKILGVARATGRGHHRGLPRDDRRDEQAARGQGRAARLRDHRGLRVHARDRPPGRARRLRQLLLLGQAAAHRRRRPRPHGRRPDGLRGQRDPSVRRGRGRRGRALVPRARHHDDRRLPPALLRQRRARARDARGAAPRAPRGRRLDQLGGAARVPRVRAVDDHARRRRGQAERQPLRHQHPRAPRRLHRWAPHPLLRHEVQRRRALRRRGRAPADHDRAVRPGGGGARRRPHRHAGPASTRCSPATAAAPRPTSPSCSTASRP